MRKTIFFVVWYLPELFFKKKKKQSLKKCLSISLLKERSVNLYLIVMESFIPYRL